MPFTRYALQVFYCHRLSDTIDAKVEIENGDLQLCCWFFDMQYTSHSPIHGETQWTLTFEFEVRQQTALRNPLFVGRPHMEDFAVLLGARHRYSVPVSPPSQKSKTHCMLRVPTSTMFSCYSSAFRNGVNSLSRLVRKTAITKIDLKLLVCFNWATEFSVLNLFIPSRFQALGSEARLRAGKEIQSQLSRKMVVPIMKRGLWRLITDFEVDPVTDLSAFAQAKVIY